MGQHPMSSEKADTVVDLLGLDPEVAEALQQMPLRGSLDSDVPVDLAIYRIHEITQVYGTTIKALIHEEFGDGITSAINFSMNIERVEDPVGERVRSPTRVSSYPTSGNVPRFGFRMRMLELP